MSIFDEAQQIADDFNTLWGAFRQSDAALKDLTNAIRARIESDKTAAAERVELLTRQSVDPARPNVVRRLAVAELEKAKAVPAIGPTQEEKAAFDAEMEQAREALQEIRITRQKLYDVLTEAKRELETIRTSSFADAAKDTELAAGWLESRQRDFNRLEC